MNPLTEYQQNIQNLRNMWKYWKTLKGGPQKLLQSRKHDL